MRAVCWAGVKEVRVERVPDPPLLNPRDAIVKVRAATLCGWDLHLYEGLVPGMARGDVLGHELVGEVVEVGPKVGTLRPGDRVVVPPVIACGECFYCRRALWSGCDNSNPRALEPEQVWGHAPAAMLGSSRLLGGYAGSLAEYVRVPFADVGPRKLPEEVRDESALFLADAFTAGFMAAEQCEIQRGDVIAVWGLGAVGQLAVKSALLLGAERVLAIDRVPERLAMAERHGAETLDYSRLDAVEALKELTGGRGPDACIEAVGMEAREGGAYERVRSAIRLEADRPHALREAIQACRKAGTVVVVGAYAGLVERFPLGAAFMKGLTLRGGLAHGHRYLDGLIDRVARGEVDPAFLATHRLGLEEAPEAFELFRRRRDGCVRVVLRP